MFTNLLEKTNFSFDPEEGGDYPDDSPESDWDIETDNDPMEKSGGDDLVEK
jgi:hypothetical protein